ncbi:MAG TPA: hypothetical protein VFV51_02640, partial [Vicinamibacterales bacterium]|nr:hypothetical protein [Vicinamibacterales bacterium]
ADKVDKAADVAVTGLDKKYSEYRTSPWKQNVDAVVEQAAGMRITLGDVTQAEIALPVDSLYSTWKPVWPEWLDQIIDHKNDDEDEKLLFKNFIARHPAAEHLGGVGRGGTFVLLYVDGGTVVGDVTLPYYWPEDAEPEPEPRPLPKPTPLPLPKKPWKVRKPWEQIWKVDLDKFKQVELDPFKKFTLEFPQMYFDALSKSAEILTTFKDRDVLPGVGGKLPEFGDKQLEAAVHDMITKADNLKRAQKLLLDHTLKPEAQAEIEASLKERESELAVAITEVGRLTSGPTVDVKTDGAQAVTLMADAMTNLGARSTTSVGNKLKGNLTNAGIKPEMKGMLGGMLKAKGLGG